MKKSNYVVSALLFASSAVWADESVLLEENGFLVFEAESIPAAGEWASSNKIGGFTGSGYYQWSGPTLLSVAKAGRDTLRYHFRVTNPGNYELRWRSRIAIGSSNTEHNDSWVRFATGSNVAGEHSLNGWTKVYMNKRDVWSWNARTVDNVGRKIRQFFSAGDHTIEISGRSTGHAIDRVVLYNYDDHIFSEDAFNTAAVSPSTQGSVELVEPEVVAPAVVKPEVVEAAQAEQATTPSLEPAQQQAQPTDASPADTVSFSAPVGSCSDGRAVVGASADLYVQSGRIIPTGDLRVEHVNRTAYIQFDASQIPQDFQSVSLQFEVGSDGGNGTLDIYSAGHSGWNEQTKELDGLPSAAVLAGTKNSQWSVAATQEIALDASVLSGGKLSLLLELQNGGGDFSIRSTDSGDSAPRLIFTSDNANFCSEIVSRNPETGAALDSGVTATLTDAGTTDAAPESGGGALGLWFAGMLLLARRRVQR